MVYSLAYRRPSHVSRHGSHRDSLSGTEKQRSIDGSVESGNSGLSSGIPDALSFDRIISGGVCPVSATFPTILQFLAYLSLQPCTTRDFMNYLKYIEHDAENLQFYLWYRDYCQRFEELSASEQALSPEWTTSQAEADAQAAQTGRRKKVDPIVASVLRGTDFGDDIVQPVDLEKRDPFHDPSRTPSSEDRRDLTAISDYGSSFGEERTLASSRALSRKADEAFDDAGMKWKPCESWSFLNWKTSVLTSRSHRATIPTRDSSHHYHLHRSRRRSPA